MKLILKHPIIASLLFITLFEVIFQHNMMLLLYMALVYITLKTTGAIKRIQDLTFAYFKKILRWSNKSSQPIDIIFINEYGHVEGNFYVKERGEFFLIKVIRNRRQKAVNIRITKIHGAKRPMKLINAPDFYITKESVMKYLHENYFNEEH